MSSGEPLRALFFDFDGTLWDSESAVFDAYRRLYAAHGEELPLDDWVRGVGTLDGFDPVADLEARLGRAVELAEVKEGEDGWDRVVGALADIGLRPGVSEYLEEARTLGLSLGVVSSNDRSWVQKHLERLGIGEVWDVIATADGDRARAKPSPTLYVEALESVGVPAREAVAVEDSPNGIAASKAAGIFTVAVPNAVTAGLDLSGADLTAVSLEDLPITRLLELAAAR
jgi:beta-phosphoglucomutase-like phosphatase (HAD superfamily)